MIFTNIEWENIVNESFIAKLMKKVKSVYFSKESLWIKDTYLLCKILRRATAKPSIQYNDSIIYLSRKHVNKY